MAAQILEDERLEEQDAVLPSDGLDSLEPLEVIPEPEEEVVEETEERYEMPDKYKDKSVQDIIHMHQEAEKLLGRQSSEVGELRKTVDSYIKTQLEEPKEQVVEEVDFFDDPQAAVSRAIENHPKIREAEEINKQYKQQTALSELQSKHPDMQDIVQDNAFVEWIGASKIRTQLYQRADQGFDVDAADELFSNWKERKQIAQQTLELDKNTRKQAVKEASTGNVRGSGESSKKVYRRADIIRMMKNDPDRYAANAEEIMKAYSQGRVK